MQAAKDLARSSYRKKYKMGRDKTGNSWRKLIRAERMRRECRTEDEGADRGGPGKK